MTSHTQHWYMLANCANSDTEEFFVSGAAQHQPTRICDGCVVKSPCLAEALDNDLIGVWGGMTDRERNALKKRRPNVKSWAKLLHAAELAYDAERIAQITEDARHEATGETSN